MGKQLNIDGATVTAHTTPDPERIGTTVSSTHSPFNDDPMHCIHGKLVGGMGYDLICGYCEQGYFTYNLGQRYQLMGSLHDTETGQYVDWPVYGQEWLSGSRADRVWDRLTFYAEGLENIADQPKRFVWTWWVNVEAEGWWS
jgi:hypothetical protein